MMGSRQWVELYTDGSCISNSSLGPGGWACILRYRGFERSLQGFVPDTTSPRMELQAAIEGLEILKRPCRIAIYTDSQWVYYGMIGRNKVKKHLDLWERFKAQQLRHIEILPNWIRGHANHTYNLKADKLAYDAACQRL